MKGRPTSLRGKFREDLAISLPGMCALFLSVSCIFSVSCIAEELGDLPESSIVQTENTHPDDSSVKTTNDKLSTDEVITIAPQDTESSTGEENTDQGNFPSTPVTQSETSTTTFDEDQPESTLLDPELTDSELTESEQIETNQEASPARKRSKITSAIESFTPTEEISADNAVPFPVDI